MKVEEFTSRPNSRVRDLWNSLFDLPKKLVRVDNSGPQPLRSSARLVAKGEC
ncbi:hypothetical protein [Nonomuraea diastatica]|uniref:hypothetical protein n=1 Tax=Nonomuraea diastatica TaxID=1848329 RepID=UPI0014086102|nr:hypothetical protein [Nonomuraea diastatica]